MYFKIFFVLLVGHIFVGVGARRKANCFPRHLDPCRHWRAAMYYDLAAGKCYPLRAVDCNFGHNFGGAPYRCGLPPDKGPCDADFERWYYDPRAKTCKTFGYDGCEGDVPSVDTDANRFGNFTSCQSQCAQFDF